MVHLRRCLGLVGALALVVALGLPASAMAKSRTVPTLSDSTLANIDAAMHGEAFAFAKYQAYAAEAARTGQRRVQRLFERTAVVEFRDHFTALAQLAGTVGSNAANLTAAIQGETFEATVMYPTFATQAAAEGCTAAHDLFTEIAGDEANHAAAFEQALAALSGSGTIPAGPTVVPVPIPAGPSQCPDAPQTRANLSTAMHGEATAYAKYTLFAEHAAATGQPQLADLFAKTAQVELREHFAEEAVIYGLVGSNAANLQDAIAGESFEAAVLYPRYAAEAEAAGDDAAADLFRELAKDESHHALQFTVALKTLHR